jgi:hypothetical protein
MPDLKAAGSSTPLELPHGLYPDLLIWHDEIAGFKRCDESHSDLLWNCRGAWLHRNLTPLSDSFHTIRFVYGRPSPAAPYQSRNLPESRILSKFTWPEGSGVELGETPFAGNLASLQERGIYVR